MTGNRESKNKIHGHLPQLRYTRLYNPKTIKAANVRPANSKRDPACVLSEAPVNADGEEVEVAVVFVEFEVAVPVPVADFEVVGALIVPESVEEVLSVPRVPDVLLLVVEVEPDVLDDVDPLLRSLPVPGKKKMS